MHPYHRARLRRGSWHPYSIGPFYRSSSHYESISKNEHEKAERESKPFINVFSRAVASDETDCFDTGMIANSIYCWNRPVHDIDDTWREPRSLTKFSNDHRCSRVTLRGFQDKGVPSYSSHRDRPEWDHPIDVRCKRHDIVVDKRTHAGKLNGAMLGKRVSVNATMR